MRHEEHARHLPLDIPCEFTSEGLRGLESATSTGFPCPLAQGRTWDRELVRAIAATGKPFVVVHVSGRPNALNWPNKVAPAIVHSFLPGPFGGQAAVGAIFGDFNPAGKTVASSVKTTGQLPLAIPGSHYLITPRTLLLMRMFRVLKMAEHLGEVRQNPNRPKKRPAAIGDSHF
jgi:hypothetical protein